MGKPGSKRAARLRRAGGSAAVLVLCLSGCSSNGADDSYASRVHACEQAKVVIDRLDRHIDDPTHDSRTLSRIADTLGEVRWGSDHAEAAELSDLLAESIRHYADLLLLDPKEVDTGEIIDAINRTYSYALLFGYTCAETVVDKSEFQSH